jgi:NAD(P)H-dependent FMN reductase
MQILVISGSRDRQGKTAQAINSILKGVSKAGAKSEVVFLTELKLERCRQCNPDGWGICRSEHRCIIEDDFDSIVNKIKSADLVVFANPVYFADLSESMRGFLDRLRRTRFMVGSVPVPGRPPTSQGIPAIAYCYAGGSGNGTTACGANMERILQTCGFDVVNVILARRQNLDMVLPLLERVGEWLAAKPTSGPWPPPAPPAR